MFSRKNLRSNQISGWARHPPWPPRSQRGGSFRPNEITLHIVNEEPRTARAHHQCSLICARCGRTSARHAVHCERKRPWSQGPTQWVYEVKWDGYRLAVHKEPDGVRILTRGGHDWTERFPAIAAAAIQMPAHTFILDGEAVRGAQTSARAAGARRPRRQGHAGEAIFFAFDLLYVDGRDLIRMPLSERRRALEPLVGPLHPFQRRCSMWPAQWALRASSASA
jgi:hypothetical protein